MKIFSNKSAGMTAVEVVLATAILAIIVPVVVSVLVKTLRISSKGIATSIIGNAKFYTTNFILTDLRSGSRHAMGSFLSNGSFENTADAVSPLYWETMAGGTGTASYADSLNAYSGNHAQGLTTGDTNPTTLDSAHAIDLNVGTAYMLTGRVFRTDPDNNGRISLVRASDKSDLGVSDTGDENSWDLLSVRYVPATSQDAQVIVRLSVINTDFNTIDKVVYFDDIALTPIHAVLTSAEAPNSVNINSNSTYPSTPTESKGYKFVRWEDGTPIQYRYLAKDSSVGTQILREKFTGSAWENTRSVVMTAGIKGLIFSYAEDESLPPKGKQTPITILYSYLNAASEIETQKINVLPMGN